MILIYLFKILTFFHLSNARVLLYNTEDSSSLEYFDCIYYTDDGLTKYCQRSGNNHTVSRWAREQCSNEGGKRSFDELLRLGVTPNEILQWSSSIEKADDYAYFFNRKNADNVTGFLCNCTRTTTFGKYCEYELLHDSISFEEAIEKQFDEKYLWRNHQYHGSILCYETLSCNFGMLCLDWRSICDGEQQCMNGMDEENCDKLEFNECEPDEYRCSNGMCIPEEYFIDGEMDCMDSTDEIVNEWLYSLTCFTSIKPFQCDEHICIGQMWSCGDGQCIGAGDRYPFYELSDRQYCITMRNLYFMCETRTNWPMWTLPSGMCATFEFYDDSVDLKNTSLSNQEKCIYLVRCLLSEGFELDCPLDRTSCLSLMSVFCDRNQPIIYPARGIIRPYLLSTYSPLRMRWNDKTPDEFILFGSIKCRGYQIHTYNHTFGSFSYKFDSAMARKSVIDFVFCEAINGTRDRFSTVKFDEHCWNNSLTFNRYPYASFDTCLYSRECLSKYRIQSGLPDCGDFSDELVSRQDETCLSVRKHRFRCSIEEPTCYNVFILGNLLVNCVNQFDEFFYGLTMSIRNNKCLQKKDDSCLILKYYVSNSSINSTHYDANRLDGITNEISRIYFQFYCDTIWDLPTKLDESNYCRQWVCARDQYQCVTGQCVALRWVCDGEWDCSDASDEEGILAIQNLSPHNRNISGLTEILKKCYQIYVQSQPFQDKCNYSTQFPCLRAHVSHPLDIESNLPCINLTQIGDGIEDCYGGWDEKNTLTDCQGGMRGDQFMCTQPTKCIEYPYQCRSRCSQGEDDVLCFYKSQNQTCNEPSDVLCFDGHCAKGARCNRTRECAHGEDEYRCRLLQTNIHQKIYRLDKIRQRDNKLWPLSWTNYPSSSLINNIMPISSNNNGRKRRSDDFDYRSFICNRGAAVMQGNRSICFCSPVYYGDKCQFYSDRLSIITHLDRTTISLDSQSVIKVIVTLRLTNQIIDYYEFNEVLSLNWYSSHKHRFHLLYSRSMEWLAYKRVRYHNRTNIIEDHPYSVYFEAYNLHINQTIHQLGAWYYTIFFDFLPSFRLATILRFSVATHHPCINNTCPLNSICRMIFNKNNSYYCACHSGYYGNDCRQFEYQCTSYCSNESICKPFQRGILSNNQRPLCICPHGHFGARCNLKFDQCSCKNNGTCIHKYDLSGRLPYTCYCSKQFYGIYCEHEKIAVRIYFNQSEKIETQASVIQYYNVNPTTLELLLLYQQVAVQLPTMFHYDHEEIEAPTLGLLKLYDQSRFLRLFIVYIKPNTNIINITTTPKYCYDALTLIEKNESAYNHSPPAFNYHKICQNHPTGDLFCFHDVEYLCICQDDYYRANCFGFNPFSDRCQTCLSGGHCIHGDLEDQSNFLCLCPRCHYGHLCQFSSQALSFTLESLLVKDNLFIQLIYLSLSFLIFIFGLFTNVCSFVTFRRPEPMSFGVGRHLFTVVILNQSALLCLFLKFLHILLGSTRAFLISPVMNLITCKSVSYLLSVSTRATYWFTSWITIQRLAITLLPTSIVHKNPRIAISIIIVTLIVVLGMHSHELLYYTIVHDQHLTAICVVHFEQQLVSQYDRITVLIHYFVPFLVQSVAITLLILMIARSRSKTNRGGQTFGQVLKNQFKMQKELYIIPAIILLSALPQTVLSFNFACTELSTVQRHLLISTYVLSYLPQMLGFLLYVLPSSNYRKEFSETRLGKTRLLRWLLSDTITEKKKQLITIPADKRITTVTDKK